MERRWKNKNEKFKMQYFIFTGIKRNLRDKRGENLMKKINRDLGINIRSLRIVNCYLIDTNNEIEEKILKEIARNVLTDKIIEKFEINKPFIKDFDYIVWIYFKPGVTDNVGRTSKIAIQDYLKNRIKFDFDVYYSNQYFIKGINYDEALKISKYLSNELIQNFKIIKHDEIENLKIPTPKVILNVEPLVEEINLNVSDEEMMNISKKRLLALNLEEMKAIKEYFKMKGRNPTDVEIECIAQTWSEHCKHKIFNAEILYIEYKNNEKVKEEKIDGLFKEYIRKATEEIKKIKGENLISVFDDNAGIVKFDEDLNFAIKVETHNAPSALDPYSGAITGILGVNRDILGAG
ncbi:MAG: AIR synthase related protein, partial [Candidatus Altarchaeaceae archaeon]